MRRLALIAVFAALTSGSANAAAWIAVCQGRDAQYMQEIGGAGFFHMGLGNGTYETQRLYQSAYDGNAVCGTADPYSAKNSEDIVQVCADKSHKAITVVYKSQPGHGTPKPTLYCDARISLH